jgi:hypothetical protein
MKIFTLASGRIWEGASVKEFHLTGANTSISAILVGEDGRGRSLGVLPVQGADPDTELKVADVGKTRSGRPKLIASAENGDADQCIVVFRTPIGFRGGNSHTGDRAGWKCDAWGCKAEGEGMSPTQCPECGKDDFRLRFAPFPGEILVQGEIAQGAAGRMGGGVQMVAVMPKGVVFRTGYSGRLYGGPSAHYYVFNGEKILAATWEERQLSDIF